MRARDKRCGGQYCFRVSVATELSSGLTNYQAQGCMSFVDGAELAEELEPVGCAQFDSEKLKVKACLTTKNRATIARALKNRQVAPKPRKP